MKRVAIYVRVSTQEQATEGYSIQEQTARLKKYCEAHEWTVVSVYTDPGYSGTNTNRPALQKMFLDITCGAFDIVLVYKLDRLSRSQKDTMFIIEDVFMKHNVDFISMNENFDTSTPFGRASVGILSVFAQLERDQIKERLMMGHVGRAKLGKWSGGSRPPLGYDYINGHLVVNEYEAMQVRLVFNLFLNGLEGEPMSLNGILHYMHDRYTNRYSSWTRLASIGLILKNRIYIGMISYGEEWYPGEHEAIISVETFDSVQKKYAQYINTFASSQRKPFEGKNLLTGLLQCGYCGARFYMSIATRTRKSGKIVRYYNYRCYTKDGFAKMKTADSCPSHQHKRDLLNQAVIDEICKLSLDPEEVRRMQTASLPYQEDTSSVLLNRLSEIDRQMGKLLDLYQLGTIDVSAISSRVDALNKEKEQLQAELKSKKMPLPAVSAEEAIKIISNSATVFEHGSLKEQQVLVRSLIEKIIVYDDHIEIHWRFCA